MKNRWSQFGHKMKDYMLPRERVIKVINHEKPDRTPLYGWVRANLKEEITASFGSVEAFEDKYEFDLAHIFGGPEPYPTELINQIRKDSNDEVEPKKLLEISLNDPNDMGKYQSIIDSVKYYKEKKGRFVYVQTPGIFECLNGPFGMENHLAYLLLYEKEMQEIYKHQAEWNKTFALNCIDIGVDMIHVSDDWGGQNSLLFSPKIWWKMIYPYHKEICDTVKNKNVYLSLHSDGNINSILDGIVKLGYDVVHPFQESAGMNFNEYKNRYKNSFVIMGGLDVQTAIGFGNPDFLKSEVERVIEMFQGEGLIYCTSHFIQKHCSMEELKYAFDLIYKVIRE